MYWHKQEKGPLCTVHTAFPFRLRLDFFDDLLTHLLKFMTKIISSDKYTRGRGVSFEDFLQSERKIAICPIIHLTLILINGVVHMRGKELRFSIYFLAESVCSMNTCTLLHRSLTRQARLHSLVDLITISYLMVTPLK